MLTVKCITDKPIVPIHNPFQYDEYQYGTGGHLGGSYPFPPTGLQRNKRHAVKMTPLVGPNCSMAWTPYVEHVGTNRHAGGSNGDIQFLYIPIVAIITADAGPGSFFCC
jgi:hypothetical protein